MMLVSRQCRYSITRSAVRGSTLSLGSRHISTEVYIKGRRRLMHSTLCANDIAIIIALTIPT